MARENAEKGSLEEEEKDWLKKEVFEESAWERGRGHFLDGNEGFSREDIKGRVEKGIFFLERKKSGGISRRGCGKLELGKL